MISQRRKSKGGLDVHDLVRLITMWASTHMKTDVESGDAKIRLRGIFCEPKCHPRERCWSFAAQNVSKTSLASRRKTGGHRPRFLVTDFARLGQYTQQLDADQLARSLLPHYRVRSTLESHSSCCLAYVNLSRHGKSSYRHFTSDFEQSTLNIFPDVDINLAYGIEVNFKDSGLTKKMSVSSLMSKLSVNWVLSCSRGDESPLLWNPGTLSTLKSYHSSKLIRMLRMMRICSSAMWNVPFG